MRLPLSEDIPYCIASDAVDEIAEMPKSLVTPLSAPQNYVPQYQIFSVPTVHRKEHTEECSRTLLNAPLSSAQLKSVVTPAHLFGASEPSAALSVLPGALVETSPSSPERPAHHVEQPADGGATFSTPHAPTCATDEYEFVPSFEVLRNMDERALSAVANLWVGRRDNKCEIRFKNPVSLLRTEITEVLRLGEDGHVSLFPLHNAPPLHSGINTTAVVSVHRLKNKTEAEVRAWCKKLGGTFVTFSGEDLIYTLNDEDGVYASELREAHQPLQIDTEKEPMFDETRLTYKSQPHVSQTEIARRLEPAPSTVAIKLPVPPDDLFSTSHVVELPYGLPDTTKRVEQLKGKVILGKYLTSTTSPVFLVNTKDSLLHNRYVARAAEIQSGAFQSLVARSFNTSSRADGMLAYPHFAAVRDGLEERGDVPEVHGAKPKLTNPYVWHSNSGKPLQRCCVAVLEWCLRHAVAEPEGANTSRQLSEKLDRFYPQVSINVNGSQFRNSLSKNKLDDLLLTLNRFKKEDTLSHVETATIRQSGSVLSLLSALYGLPDSDKPFEEALEEQRYLRQLRHRNLVQWLNAELRELVSAHPVGHRSRGEQLVQYILCRQLGDAQKAASDLGEDDVAAVVRICGEGSQFGSYVQMAKNRFRDGEEVRDRVVALLSGQADPFLRAPEYVVEGKGADGPMTSDPTAATWKQILGIFAFYGCSPDAPAEDIIHHFSTRLEDEGARERKPLPPYSERLGEAALAQRKGRDLVRKGRQFRDSAYLVLKGFAAGSAPPAAALHPNASSYSPTDFLTPFLILLCIRAAHVARDRSYRTAETTALVGVAAQLELCDDLWFWGLLPLHMIESEGDRLDAVQCFCRRNAVRVETARKTDTFCNLLSLLRVDEEELRVAEAPVETAAVPVRNEPSINMHLSLRRAIQNLMD
ncbi:nucleoporin [Strigomonas culicis]|uniref:Nucleoporin n=1 Tax=Strigomonas culicis TaxID=28005 RepID=S9UAJ0_9TRYP|nr:nucleoporin [Strigomonas culicis]|eukprot:EPY27807.1 nucleoporin [Strigomonas culicis]